MESYQTRCDWVEMDSITYFYELLNLSKDKSKVEEFAEALVRGIDYIVNWDYPIEEFYTVGGVVGFTKGSY